MPTDPTGVMGLPSGTTPATTASGATSKTDRERARIKKAAQDFESVFVGMMLKQMRKSMTGSNSLFGSSSQAKMYQDMMDDITAQQMSKTSPFGLATTLERSMEKRLGHSENNTAATGVAASQAVSGAVSTPAPTDVPLPKRAVQKIR